jgi:hypothetical protein
MSANPAGDEIRDETAPLEPPDTPNLLASLRRLVVPGTIAVLTIYGVFCGLIPLVNMMGTASNNLEKVRKDSLRSFSHNDHVPAPPPPVYAPGNNPNGPFTPKIP